MRKSGTPSACGVCLIFPSTDDRFTRCVSWFLLLQERVLSLKSKMYDSLEKTPPRPRDLFYIFPLLLFCADGVPFYTLSLEKWYAVIPTVLPSVVFSVLARSHFLKFCQFWKLSKMQKNFPFFWGFLVAWSKNACLFSRKVCGIKMKKKREESWLEKNRFFINFLFPLQFFERSLKCLLILKVWNLAARSSWDVIHPRECQTQG